MALTAREKLLNALQNYDLNRYHEVLIENQENLKKFVDSRGKNPFHDLCSFSVDFELFKGFFHLLKKVFNELVKEFLNSLAYVDEDRC
jgi:hypothetical protein